AGERRPGRPWLKASGPRLPLLPFDGAGRLAGDVVDNPVDALDLVHDAVRYPAQDLVWEPSPVRRHGILRSDDAHRHQVRVGAEVAHDAHGLERREHGEGLPDLAV